MSTLGVLALWLGCLHNRDDTGLDSLGQTGPSDHDGFWYHKVPLSAGRAAELVF